MKDPNKANPPLELIIKGGDPEKVAVFACSVCRLTARSEEDAKMCCVPWTCETCGKEIKSYCEECSRKKQQVKDQATYDKATKVKYSEYKGQMLFCDHCDEYFWDLDGYLEHDESPDIRTWAWGTYQQAFSLDAEDIIQNQLENGDFNEDAFESVPGDAIKEMQSFFDGWVVKNPLNSYMQDHSIVVDLEKEVMEFLKENADDAPTDAGSDNASNPGVSEPQSDGGSSGVLLPKL